MSALWTLRHAVPWPSLGVGLGMGAVLVAAGHRWDSVTGLALPLVVLLAAAGSAFVHDDPARTVTAVTPRGGRWAPGLRLLAGWVPACAAALLVALAPGEASRGWWLVVGACTSLALVLATAASRRQVTRPGSAVAGAVVLLGLTPLTVGPMLDLPDVYPGPALTHTATWTWTLVLSVSLLLTAWLLTAHPHHSRSPHRS